MLKCDYCGDKVISNKELRHIKPNNGCIECYEGTYKMINKCWIILYHHRHGIDTWPIFQQLEPTEKQIITQLDNYEENRDDEYIEIVGPFDLP